MDRRLDIDEFDDNIEGVVNIGSRNESHAGKASRRKKSFGSKR